MRPARAPVPTAEAPGWATALLGEIRALRADLGADEPDSPQPEALALVRAIADTVGTGYTWTVGELLEYAELPTASALRAALLSTVGSDAPAKRLGKLLRAHAGLDLDGLAVIRSHRDRDGAHWRVIATV